MSDEQRASTQSNDLPPKLTLRTTVKLEWDVYRQNQWGSLEEIIAFELLQKGALQTVHMLCLVTLEGILKTFKYAQPLDEN